MTAPKLITKIVKSKDGTELFAEACGDPTKQAIVFAHGFACAGIHFDDLFALEKMQANLFLVRWDTRAHGRSAKPLVPEAYESTRYGEDFDAVCDAFNVRSPIFLGWSAGGSTAADIFAYGNTKPTGIILIAGPAYNPPGMRDMLTPLLAKLLVAFMQSDPSSSSVNEIAQQFCSAFSAPERLPLVPSSVMDSWIKTALQFPPQCAVLGTQKKQDPSHLVTAAEAGLPLCIISGKEDLLIRGDVVIEKMTSVFINNEVHLLDGLGHIPFWEDPMTVANIILSFTGKTRLNPKH